MTCYSTEEKSSTNTVKNSTIRTVSVTSNSDVSTAAPSLYLSHLSDTTETSHEESDIESSPELIFERMRQLASKRRYDGVHIRRGDKLVLNM